MIFVAKKKEKLKKLNKNDFKKFINNLVFFAVLLAKYHSNIKKEIQIFIINKKK